MKTLTYGTIPSKPEITEACERECPDGYTIIGITDPMVEATGHIDSHLEAVFFETVTDRYNRLGIVIEPASVHTFVRRLTAQWERGDEQAGYDASSILYSLGFEWI